MTFWFSPIQLKITNQLFKKFYDNLYLKPEKCNFETDHIDYLGIIVGNGTVRMDPKKVAVLNTWPTPLKKRDVQSFLGFCNFFSTLFKVLAPSLVLLVN